MRSKCLCGTESDAASCPTCGRELRKPDANERARMRAGARGAAIATLVVLGIGLIGGGIFMLVAQADMQSSTSTSSTRVRGRFGRGSPSVYLIAGGIACIGAAVKISQGKEGV